MSEGTEPKKELKYTKATITAFLSDAGVYTKQTLVEYANVETLRKNGHKQLLANFFQEGMWRQVSENGLEHEFIPFSRIQRIEVKIDEPSALSLASEAEVPGVAALHHVLETTKNRG